MSVLIKPLITEKVSALNEQGKYGFLVEPSANKVEIRKAVEEAYGVKVDHVATINVMGKRKTRYTKSNFTTGRKPSTKKAIVTVKAGEVIDFYSGI